jgi:hypothetical protein
MTERLDADDGLRTQSDLPVLFPYPRIYPGECLASLARILRSYTNTLSTEQYAYACPSPKYVIILYLLTHPQP